MRKPHEIENAAREFTKQETERQIAAGEVGGIVSAAEYREKSAMIHDLLEWVMERPSNFEKLLAELYAVNRKMRYKLN